MVLLAVSIMLVFVYTNVQTDRKGYSMKFIKTMAASAASLIMAGGLAGSALAVSPISNGSFETGPANPGAFDTLSAGDTSITGWTVTTGDIDYINSYWQSSDGNRSLDMNGAQPGGISQNLVTAPGHTYKVTFDLAGNPVGGPAVKTLDVDSGGLPTTYSFDTTGRSVTDMGWTSETYMFTASGTSTPLTFTSTTGSGLGNFWGPALDNVAVSDATTKDACKDGGWKNFGSPSFKNQGDCVSYFQSSDNATGNKTK